MPLNEKNVRGFLRWLHIVLGLIIMCYVYSPFYKYIFFQMIVKFLVVPVIAFSGIWLWKFKAINKFFHVSSCGIDD